MQAIVTGASGAIGGDVARELASAGYRVILQGRRRDRLDALAGVLGNAIVVPGDVTVESTWDAVLNAAGEAPIDCLVHAAGGNGDPVSFADLDVDAFRRCLDDNLTSTFLAMHTVVPRMCAAGRGVVVTLASAAGQMVFSMSPKAASPAYCAAKAGVITLTQQCARESARFGVRVSCVAPGPVMNERIAALPAEIREGIGKYTPLGAIGTPADVTRAVMYLVQAPWVTGEVLSVSGGMVMP